MEVPAGSSSALPNALSRRDLQRRLESLRTERQSWISQWRDISTYLLPRNGRYLLQDRNIGNRRHNQIFDASGGRAAKTLAAGLMAGMTSPARPWLRFVTRDRDLMKSQPVKIWLSECAARVLLIFAKGNTYRTLHQLYKEEGAFGTAATVTLDDYQSVMWHYPLTVGEYMIAQNWRGEIDTLYREFEKPVSTVVREFVIDKDTGAFHWDRCSNTVKSLWDNGSLDAWVPLVHAIEPRQDRIPGRLDAKNMPWRSVYWERGNNQDKFLRESGFEEFPAYCPRWEVEGGDVYGNGPGMEALGDIKGLQQKQLRKSQAIDQLTRPSMTLPTSMKNREIDGLPGGISYFDQAVQSHRLYDVQADVQHLLIDIQDVRQLIDKAFFADLFLMISGADPRMTATEVAARQEEKMLMLGPVIERNSDELLNPLVRSTFRRAMRAGLLPPPPPEMHMQAFDVEYVSVLAQAQRAISVNSIDRFVGQMFTVVAPAKPEVLDRFDPDQWAEVYSDALGVDPELIVPGDKAALVRKQRAQMQAQAQQAALNNQRADTAQKLGSTPTGGGGSNLLQDLTNQFSGYTSPSPVEVGQ